MSSPDNLEQTMSAIQTARFNEADIENIASMMFDWLAGFYHGANWHEDPAVPREVLKMAVQSVLTEPKHTIV